MMRSCPFRTLVPGDTDIPVSATTKNGPVAFLHVVRGQLLTFFDGRLKPGEAQRLFGAETENDVPYASRFKELGNLLDACSNAAAKHCWPASLAIHYKLRCFHDACFLEHLEGACEEKESVSTFPVPCEESLPEYGLPEIVMLGIAQAQTSATKDSSTTFGMLVEKCFPRSCAMRDFAKKLRAMHGGDHTELLKVVLVQVCALLGNFRHCNIWLSAKHRRAVLSVYAATKEDALAQARLDFASDADPNQIFLYSAFREFLCAVVARCPCLTSYLEKRYKWNNMCTMYVTEMDLVRADHNGNADGATVACVPSNLMPGAANRLRRTKMNAPHTNTHVAVSKNTFRHAVVKTLAAKWPLCGKKYFPTPALAKVWTGHMRSIPMGTHVPLRMMLHFLSKDGQAAMTEAVEAWGRKEAVGPHVESLSEDDAAAVHGFFIAQATMNNIRVTKLPDAVAHAQYRAAARRFASQLRVCRAGDRRMAATWAGQVRFCGVCNSIRNFVEMVPTKANGAAKLKKKRKRQGDGAIGFNGCVHSVETKTVSCKGTSASNERTKVCRSSLLLETNMLHVDDDEHVESFSIFIANAEYMLSPCCAMMCKRQDVTRTNTSAGWSCPTCRREDISQNMYACDFCERKYVRAAALSHATLMDDMQTWQSFGFCKTHTRAWFTGEANAYKYSAAQVFADLQNVKVL